MRLLHITDTHLFADESAVLYERITSASLKRVLAAARESDWPPDGILATGDLTHDETEGGYVRFRDLTKDLGCPVHCLPGNHDIPDLMYRLLNEKPFTVNDVVIAEDWLIVLLDSTIPGSDDGRLGDSELDRLETALANNTGRPALICLHHNPVVMGSPWLDRMILKDADKLFAIIDRYPGVRAVLWGHVHQAFDTMCGQVRLISTPSTFAQFAPRTETYSLDTKPAAYRWLDLNPDGSLSTQLVWMTDST